MGHYLAVAKWKPNFRPSVDHVHSTMVWVRFPELPMELFDEEILYAMGNAVGRAIKIDSTTLTARRGRYARVCVEVKLDAPLIPFLTLLGAQQLVEYEGLHMICFGCGKFGHRKDACDDQGPNGHRYRLNSSLARRRKPASSHGCYLSTVAANPADMVAVAVLFNGALNFRIPRFPFLGVVPSQIQSTSSSPSLRPKHPWSLHVTSTVAQSVLPSQLHQQAQPNTALNPGSQFWANLIKKEIWLST